MSTDAAAERGSQPAQRDELVHSRLDPCAYSWRGFTSHERYPTYCDYEGLRVTLLRTDNTALYAVQYLLYSLLLY